MEVFDLSAWQHKDPLTLGEAAYLWAGLPPGLLKAHQLHPERYAAARERFRQIKQAAEAGVIKYDRPEENRTVNKRIPGGVDLYGRVDLNGWSRASTVIKTTERGPVSWEYAKFTRAALRQYADSVGVRPSFLFPEAAEVSALRCLDRTGPHFSEELEAAILAWQYASEQAADSKKKPRALIVDWLQENRPKWDKSGKAFERVATLANWEKTTGPKALK